MISMLLVNQGDQDSSGLYGYWTKINKREPYNGYLFTKGNHYLVEYYEFKKSRENFNDLGNVDYEVTLEDYRFTIKDSIITSSYYNKMLYHFRNDTLIIKRNGSFDTLLKSRDQKTPVEMEKFNVKLYLNS
jgi:hypothetical protein